MIEVTREALEEALEIDKKANEKFQKNLQKFMVIFLVVCFVDFGASIFFFRYGLWALVYIAGAALFDVLFLVVGGAWVTSRYTGELSLKRMIFAKKNNELNRRIRDAEIPEQIRLYEEKLAVERGAGRLVTLSALDGLYRQMDMRDWSDVVYSEAMSLKPKNLMQEVAKFDIMRGRFDTVDGSRDADYIRVCVENEALIHKMWGQTLAVYRLGAVGMVLNYHYAKKEYAKALEYYMLWLEYSEKYSAANPGAEFPDELTKSMVCIDLAALYLKNGDAEKARECYNEAMERFGDTNVPFIRQKLSLLEKDFSEAGVIM